MAPEPNVRHIESRLKATEHAVARLKVDTGLLFTTLARNSPSLGEARRYVEQARRSYRVATRYSASAGAESDVRLRSDLMKLCTAIADLDALLRQDSGRIS
jgi:hypothetical protein